MGAVIDMYECSMCSTTLPECKNWGPVCGMTGRRVCAECCRICDCHISWSGIWKCSFVTPERKREEAMKRISSRFNEENKRVSQAYREKRREEARLWAIKQAKRKKTG